MPIRWVLCPMILVEGLNVGELDHEGHEITKKIDRFESKARSLVVGRVQAVEYVRNTNGRLCLCQVRSDDFSKIDADPECLPVFEEDEPDFDTEFGEGRTETLRSKGWNQGKVNRVVNALEAKGVDFTGTTLSLDTPKRDIIRAIRASIKSRRVL